LLELREESGTLPHGIFLPGLLSFFAAAGVGWFAF
jgi:hypothetical protein